MNKKILAVLTLIILLLQACGGSFSAGTETALADALATSEPIVHVTIPSAGTEIRASAHDNELSLNFGNKDVIFGDEFAKNRFERPFTAIDMTYLPDIDIVDFSISSDDNFFYIRIDLVGLDLVTQSLTGSYGVEFDKNGDGRAEILLITQPPYSQEFTADNVFLFIDVNGDVGGEKVAAPDTQVADGFEAIMFALSSNIHPEDADLAWVRFINDDKPAIEIAYKKWLFKDGNETFMWSVFADDAILNPSFLNLHDHISEAEAGSPTKSNPNYPVSGLAGIDNTCRVPFGYDATGNEPLGCAVNTSVFVNDENVAFCDQFPTACNRQPDPPIILIGEAPENQRPNVGDLRDIAKEAKQ